MKEAVFSMKSSLGPLTPETHHRIGVEALAQVQTGVMLINTSCGVRQDKAAVIEAMKTGHYHCVSGRSHAG